jgi:hypothetical protein
LKTLNLTSGFWQMLLQSDSIPKTAFILPGLGQCKWLMSPMGLLGCPASFQKLMEKLMDKIDNLIAYTDDLLIHSQTNKQHLAALDMVINRLSENHIKINLSKCFFGNIQVDYLGFMLTSNNIKPG